MLKAIQSPYIMRLILCLSILAASLILTSAATPASAFVPERPLGEMLNPNGTLSLATDLHGSLDARGWHLVSGPHQPPRFAPQSAPLAVPGNQDWASNFGFRGVSYPVFSIAVDSRDNVYAGGFFTAAGNVAANYVAKWNASGWSALSNGTNFLVQTVTTDSSGNVYVGGFFSSAADHASPDKLPDALADPKTPEASTNFIAKWDGSSWSSLGSGTNSIVVAIAVDGNGNMYAGGAFTIAGGVTVNGIAKWNGSSWSPLGHGFNAPVYALAVDSSNNVYAGGLFNRACDATCAPATSTPANYIAKWNGSAWSGVGNGVNAAVQALAVDSSNNLYAGGGFANICGAGPGCPVGATVNNIAKWNGSAWSALGNGINGLVEALTVDHSNQVYASGLFATLCGPGPGCPPGPAVNYVAKWNGSAWSAMGGGTNGPAMALGHDSSNNIYAGGTLTKAGSTAVSFIAKWNSASSSWSAMGNGDAVDDTVGAFARDSNNNVYVGGAFHTAGGVTVNGVAKWNGAAWSVMGHGFDSSVAALAVDGSNNVYAGGFFTLICDATCNPATSTPVNGIAKWNGSTWSAVGNGFPAGVFALAIDSSNNVYAGGSFDFLCGAGPGCPVGATVNHIAKWSAGAWSAMDNGFDNNVRALAVDSTNKLYAGGEFKKRCAVGPGCLPGDTVNYIATWNGASWQRLAEGLSDAVYALAVDRRNNLYVGGSFMSTMGGVFLFGVGRWDGASWWALGNGLDDVVNALAVDSNNNVYAGGLFTLACDAMCDSGTVVNRTAMWTDSGWAPVGSGTNGTVFALMMRDKTLFVGGDFTAAGGKGSGYIASIATGQVYLPLMTR